ncbi:pyridoxamine 5'-phosphate oxidase [Kriegella sp. EG-1]|nr:pyridoxamine 5'-phosphate oxidase [Flavobacteriaceae bacterium EG-1]
MEKDLSNYRRSYEKSALTESVISENPMQLFQTWFYEVENSESGEEHNAMTISTIGLDGFPKNRVVLLKKYTEEGFIFYTNYESEKGKAIEKNPNVCISFFWSILERQIIIKGKAEKINKNLSDGYFDSRPMGSKLGAIVSNQSTVIPSREFLENKLMDLEEQLGSNEIERPNYWGGYIVKPISMEFWQGRPNRLHDRIRYTLKKNFEWTIERLAP